MNVDTTFDLSMNCNSLHFLENPSLHAVQIEKEKNVGMPCECGHNICHLPSLRHARVSSTVLSL